MASTENIELRYAAGTVDVPHLGITLRRIFGCAGQFHDIERDGREVKITVEGVYVGTLQLKDAILKGKQHAKGVRADPPRR